MLENRKPIRYRAMKQAFVLLALHAFLGGCMVYYPTDVKLVAVTAVDFKERAELGWREENPYNDLLRKLYFERKGGIIRRGDVEPFFSSPQAEKLESVKPSRPMLKVEFGSKENLSEYVHENGYTLGFQGYFCGYYNKLTIPVAVKLGSSVYWGPFDLYRSMNYLIEQEVGEPIIYHALIEVDLPPNSFGLMYGPQDNFDFRVEARDVCFVLLGGAAPAPIGFKSNEVMIPKTVIAEALKDLPPAPRIKENGD